jgi:hypothetical protein
MMADRQAVGAPWEAIQKTSEWQMTMNQKDEDFICFYRDAVIAGHDDPAAETMHHFNLSRDYTIRLLNEAIAGCDGQDIRNWNRRMRRPS